MLINGRIKSMKVRAKRIIAGTTFATVYVVGVTLFWNLPKPVSDASPLFAFLWFFMTTKITKWSFVKIGWTTHEAEASNSPKRS